MITEFICHISLFQYDFWSCCYSYFGIIPEFIDLVIPVWLLKLLMQLFLHYFTKCNRYYCIVFQDNLIVVQSPGCEVKSYQVMMVIGYSGQRQTGDEIRVQVYLPTCLHILEAKMNVSENATKVFTHSEVCLPVVW